MGEYNFEPDYSQIWMQENLSYEDILWAMNGVSPDDIQKYISLNKVNGLSSIDSQWIEKFELYILLDTRDLQGNINRYLALDEVQKATKEKLVQYIYDRRFYAHSKFLEYLIKIDAIKINTELEAYKNEFFTFKGNANYTKDNYFDNKEDEIEIVCSLLDIDSFAVEKYLKLSIIPEIHNPFNLVDCSNDNLWFWYFFNDFLCKDSAYQKIDFIKSVKEAGTFRGTIAEYVQALYDKGVIFSQSVYKKIGLENISFSENSAVNHFYRYWCSVEGWTLEQAISLVEGKTPEQDFQAFNQDDKPCVEIKDYNNNNTTILEAWSRTNGHSIFLTTDNHVYNTRINLSNKLQIYAALHNISFQCELPFQEEGQGYKPKNIILYKPNELIRWLLNECPIIPPLALIECLFQGDTKYLEEYHFRLEERRKKQEKAQREKKYDDIKKIETKTAVFATIHKIIKDKNFQGSSKIKRAIEYLKDNQSYIKSLGIESIDLECYKIKFMDESVNDLELRNIKRQVNHFITGKRKAFFNDCDECLQVQELR